MKLSNNPGEETDWLFNAELTCSSWLGLLPFLPVLGSFHHVLDSHLFHLTLDLPFLLFLLKLLSTISLGNLLTTLTSLSIISWRILSACILHTCPNHFCCALLTPIVFGSFLISWVVLLSHSSLIPFTYFS